MIYLRRNMLYKTGSLFFETPPSNGVYSYFSDGLYSSATEYTDTEKTNIIGIAVITNKCAFVIDKKNTFASNGTTLYWGCRYNDVASTGVTNTSNEAVAITDYNGLSHTLKIYNTYGIQNTDTAIASRCYIETFSNSGYRGYLGSYGEYYLAWLNKSGIDAMLVASGGTALTYQWTSTIYEDGSDSINGRYAWYFNWPSYNGSNYWGYKLRKSERYYARAFFKPPSLIL